MNWINIRTETLRRPEFVRAKPGSIETWLRVMAYCCEQENDGVILEGVSWDDRAWLSACSVTKAEVQAAAPLIYDDGVAVFVEAFPSEKQAEVQAKRVAGKKGGKKSRKSTAKAAGISSASPGRITERNGIGREGEGNGSGSGSVPKPQKNRGTRDEIKAFAVELGLPASDGEACFDRWEGNGWKNNGEPIVDWRSTMRSWKQNNYLPSLKHLRNGGTASTTQPIRSASDAYGNGA